jgi:hypothetical protein
MSYGPRSVFALNCASNVTLTSALDLGRAWTNVYLEVPTMTSGCNIYVQAAASATGTFHRVYQRANSGTAQVNAVQIPSSVTQAMVDIPGGFQHLKVELSTAMTATSVNFKVHCAN